MMFFTGSDWCGWCIRLQKEVFFKEDFKKWAQENVVLLELDFPRRKALAPDIKAQNTKLQSQFAIRGYPTVWFVTPDKDAQGNLQWGKTRKNWLRGRRARSMDFKCKRIIRIKINRGSKTTVDFFRSVPFCC